jgi:2-methylcitrate dehydratase PrpD
MSERAAAAPGLTAALVAHSLAVGRQPLATGAATIATHSLLDWTACAMAGWNEAPVRLLGEEAVAEGAGPEARLLDGRPVSALQAALVNGTAGHMLDFDDAHLPSRVHPSVPLWPALLAEVESLAAKRGDAVRGPRLLSAFAAGVEMQSRLARVIGDSHYKRGWHNTATLGSFGAAAAVGALHGVDEATLASALGIVATQVGGLRVSFGTMGKPLHAGRAAALGLQAVRLARRGFAGPADVLERPNGFVALYGGGPEPDTTADASAMGAPERLCLHDIVYKFNASCYGTQAPIEACKLLLADASLQPGDIESIEVIVEPQYLTVCCIPDPDTATQAKFSIAFMVALVLAGRSTVDGASFEPAALRDPMLRRLVARVRVRADALMPRANAEVRVSTLGGGLRSASHDASWPETDLGRQQRQLVAKARALFEAGPCARVGAEWVSGMLDVGAERDVAQLLARLYAASAPQTLPM